MSLHLRQIMAKHLITVKMLALEAKMSQGNISRIINNRQRPYPDNCYRLTEAINSLTGKSYHVNKLFPDL